MAITLKSDYEVAIRIKDGGGQEQYVPLDTLNTYISTEETSGISDLQAQVGDIDPATMGTVTEKLESIIGADLTTPDYTPAGASIAADISTLYTDVETASTGLKDIVTAASTGLVDRFGSKTLADFGNKSVSAYVYDQLRQPGVELKLSKVAAGSDDIPETQTGKVVVSPIINPAGTLTHATANVPYSTGAGAVTITALVPGSAAHTTQVDISAPAGTASAALTLSGTYPTDLKIGYKLAVSGGVPTTGEANTAYGFYKALINNSTILQHFRVETMTVADTGIMDVTTALMFSGGGAAAPVPLAASGEDIDAVVDEFVSAGSLIYTPTGTTTAADINTLWTDVETAGTGIKAVVGTYAGGSDISTELAAVLADVGTYAGGADIASDLSSAEGDIDDLEAVAPASGTPTLAVAASKVLTIGTKPAEGAIVTIGTTNYKFRATALGAGAKATGTLDMTADAPHAGDTVISGAQTYTYVAALTEAKATATYTTDTTQPVDGSSVVVNDQTYRFKSTTEQANDVKISAVDADGTLANLVLAINASGTGDGSDYHAGTVAATGVVAAGVAAHATVVTADAVGTAANAFLKSATTDPDSHIDVDAGGGGTTFSGGVAAVPNEILVEATSADAIDNLVAAIMDTAGEGTKYSTGTVTQETVVTAARALNTMTVEYAVVGFAGNLYDTAGTMTHGSWGAAKLAGGIDAQAAYDVYDGGDIENSIINLEKAIEDSGTEGTHYGTGTAVHPDVYVSDISTTTLTATAKVAGTAGNSIALAETLADGSWAGGAGFLTGGVNGTVATAGKMYVNGQNLYVASANTTVSNSNGWKRVLLHYVAPVEIDLSDGTDYTVPTDAPPSIVIVTETDGTDGDIYLPPATGSMNQITISIQHATNDIVVNPSVAPGTDTINLGATLTIAALSTVTLLDYATGKWMAI